MQTVRVAEGAEIRKVPLPDPDEEVMPGVRWGRVEEIGAPSFWAAIARIGPDPLGGRFATGDTLAEEVGFCLLGGHGVTFEVAAAAFERLRSAGAFDLRRPLRKDEVERLLRRPMMVGGRSIRYRFPSQRAERISVAMRRLADAPPPEHDHLVFRSRLMDLPGIGPKTASWITRNWLASDEVAILDIHIIRACLMMGVFKEPVRLPRDYFTLEKRFLDFARRIGVRPSVLDAIIWSEMRELPPPRLQAH